MTDQNRIASKRIIIKEARASFPKLFKADSYGGGVAKYSVDLLIPEGSESDKAIRAAISDIAAASGIKRHFYQPAQAAWDRGVAEGRKEGPLPAAMKGMMVLKAASTKKPVVVDQSKQPLAETDGRPYGGCYVNAVVDIGIARPKPGTGASFPPCIKAYLGVVQFVKDGEPFGGSGTPFSLDVLPTMEDNSNLTDLLA